SGALGIVTGAVFELDLLPASRACAWVVPVGPRPALDALIELERRTGPWLEAFEVVSAEAFDATTGHLRSAARPFGGRPTPEVAVLVELAGPDPDAEDRLVSALDALSDAGLIEDAVVLDSEHAWSFRHGI